MRYALFFVTFALLGADLAPETQRDYERYLAGATREMANGPLRFQPAAPAAPEVSPWGDEPTANAAKALIHDWVGAVFVPGVNARRAVALLTDFDRHSAIYAPDVIASKSISVHNGLHRSSLRVVKSKVITVVLDTEYETRYVPLNDRRWLGTIRSTRVQEVRNAGDDDESLLPEGTGHGFLWRINSWWVVEERNGGVILQLRSVSLTRDIPFGLSWMIKPMVTGLPRETLTSTLEKTAKALRGAG